MDVLQTSELCACKWLIMEGVEAQEKVSVFLVEDGSRATTGKKQLLSPSREMPIAESMT